MTVLEGAAGIYSDDFQSSSTLDSEWTHDAGGPATGTYGWWGQGTGDAGITLTIPSTGLFDSYESSLNANHIYQSCTDNDFTIETRWTTDGSAGEEELGMFIGDAARDNYVGILWYGTTLFSGALTDGDDWADGGGPATDRRIRMRYVSSTGSYYADYWNGSGWTLHGSAVSPGYSWDPETVGIFVGNNVTDNGHSQNCDYFFEDSAPIVPEDGTGTSRRVMVIS